MTTLDYIKQSFSYIGKISDVGASKFALDNGFDIDRVITSEDMKAISASTDRFVNNNILHPESVNENGFSVSWGADSIQSYIKLMLKKYGIELNEETSALVGLGVVSSYMDY